MQTMRYINLLDKESRVKTRNCFIYNNTIIFAVPGHLISRAIGHEAANVRKIQEKLGKRVRIIPEALGLQDVSKFIQNIVEPAKFKTLEINGNELIITAGGTQNKANLLGRNKRRYEELRQIVQDVFFLDLKII